ncbi:phosphoserine phosphatase [Brachionus plicatilis]|uniref:Phosphoserine phosphatase n=1 Tax=Brachionus plicatilis TaxID=10195 RepID=A0A3M7P4M1_BRAPC|nr:phosphoserine phosphatase [Brachionus plicatilis]
MSIQNKQELVNLWKNADCVCFDVDSTVCINEAIDDLAEFAGMGSEVHELTKKAMGGNVTFKQALAQRLNIIKPSKKLVEDFIRNDKCKLTPKLKDLVDALLAKKVSVYLVSGGFRLFINPIADKLNLPKDNIFANTLIFDQNGEYLSFDENEYTSESGGKARVIDYIKKKHGYNKVVMIGDGWTDYESCPPADGFIGFGGNVVRENVKSKSLWFVYDFQELIDALKN